MQISKIRLCVLLISILGLFAAVFIKYKYKTGANNIQTGNKSQTYGRHDNKIQESKTACTVLDEPTNDDLEKNSINDLALLEKLTEIDLSTAMDMRWDSKSVTCNFEDYEKVADTIQAIPIINKAMVTNEQLKTLHDVITQMVFDNGTHNIEAYFDYMKKNGQTISTDSYNSLRKALKEEVKIPEMEIASEPWDLAVQFCETYDYCTSWQGLVSEDSEIKLFKTQTSTLDLPGKILANLREACTNFARFTVPPKTIEYEIQSKGEVILADAKVYIQHADKMGAIVRPYIIRYWYDSDNSVWRPLEMTCFQNRHEHFDVRVLY